jgi:hypothetical protein
MITLSKSINASQAQAYHKAEFSNARENYYTEDERVLGEWQGKLAAKSTNSSSRAYLRGYTLRQASSWSGIKQHAST